ncbi:cold-shock protein [Pediococcus siamensis]|uniref:cold-shock protein n=1 Tax=Pediococcus siamensis TaxID=381829 RepID=UPI0039A04790
MEHGVVKSFNQEKGYGFITLDDGTEVFVHYSAIEGSGFKTLQVGDSVTLMVVQGAKGLQAVKVSLLESPENQHN